jgi:protein phosphatase PTC7
VVAQSRPLEHYFDCPLQFGAWPDFVDATDTSTDAELYTVPLAVGDVIIAGAQLGIVPAL